MFVKESETVDSRSERIVLVGLS
ncbi:unnamed protein product [Linum tenue]|uniref:Uncharacterized protein n=1 Tax=Linum tenue TaxID=586396 RepID=A0AAV0RXV5_9ROSI|nr:unnamed protein product [Linum tenue]